MKKVAFFLILTSWALGSLMAQENITSTEYNSPVKKWSAVAYLDTRAGMENETGANGALTSTFQGIFRYSLGNGYTARALVAAYHDFRKIERQNELYNGYVALSKKLPLTKELTLITDVRAYVPLSRIERENKSFRTKLYIAPKITIDLSSYGLKGLELSYETTFAQNFYQFETGISGYANTKNYITHTFSAGYAVTEKLSLALNALNTHRWTYYSTQRPDVFEFSFDVSYRLNKSLNVGIGYSVGDTTFGYDGSSFNVDLLDLTKSSIYTSLSYVF